MIKIEAARLVRCNADGTRSDEGMHVLVEEIRITASKGAADVKTCVLSYTDEDGETHDFQMSAAALIAGYKETAPTLLVEDAGAIVFLLGFDYGFSIKVADSDGTVQTMVVVPRVFANFHQSGATTGGAAFGMYSTATDGNPKLESAFPFHGYGGVYGEDGNRLDGVNSEVIKELSGSFAPYDADEYPVVSRIGKLVILSGKLTPTASIAGGTDEHTMFSLPRAYCPVSEVYQVCQGASYNKWLMHVSAEGVVSFSRYSTSSAASAAAGTLLPFQSFWIASDYKGPIPVQRPAAAMTSNNSQGCIASASSVYHTTSYPAWKAFDYKETTSWASSNSSTMWLQLEMDVALTDITVYVYARQSKYLSSPMAGRVLCSNDGSSWTPMAEFSGWNGKQNGGLMGKLACGNETPYRFVRLEVTERLAGSTYVAVGYMKITGIIPE